MAKRWSALVSAHLLTLALAWAQESYKPGELLVRYRPSASTSTRHLARLQAHSALLRSYSSVPGLELMRVKPGTPLGEALEALRRNPDVLYAEPNYRVRAVGTVPNDTAFAEGLQWALHNTGQNGGSQDADIDAPEAWEVTTGSSSVVVAVIDTGVDYFHPDLQPNLIRLESNCGDGIDNDGNGHVDDCYGYDAITKTSNPADENGHGTFVSGIIGARANNGVGIAGVNWNVGLLACKFLDAQGEGWDADAVGCLDYIKDLKDNYGINIVATNNSWGGAAYSQALFDAIEAQQQSGILFIVAAGNSGADTATTSSYPANFRLLNIIAVAATDRTDALARYSSYGNTSVHVGAPGSQIYSTLPGNSYGLGSGTSAAAPFVTGVAALLKAQDPNRDWVAIRNSILAGGDDLTSLAQFTITGKRLNAYGALTCSNQALLKRLQPIGAALVIAANTSVPISVLHINCAAPAGELLATVQPVGPAVRLQDQGEGQDQIPADGVYSGVLPPLEPGSYTVEIAGDDSFTLEVLRPYYFSPDNYEHREIEGSSLALERDGSALLQPSFPLQIAGRAFDSLYVNMNGVITLKSAFGQPAYSGILPTGDVYIAPYWTSLFGSSPAANVFWEETGLPPNRELVIEWREVTPSYWLFPPPVTFQVIFFERSDEILFNYAVAPGPSVIGLPFGPTGPFTGIQIAPDSLNRYPLPLWPNSAVRWSTVGPDHFNPDPAIISIIPESVRAGGPGVTLSINGTNFAESSVLFMGWERYPAQFISSSQLVAELPAAKIQVAGEIPVQVFNFGAQSYGSMALPVVGPVIESISPASVLGGGPAFRLTIYGRGFALGDVLLWNDVAKPTIVVSERELIADIDAAALAACQVTASIQVKDSQGGVSQRHYVTVEDFALVVEGGFAWAEVQQGQAAHFSVRAGDNSNLAPARLIKLTCSAGVPPQATCSFQPATIYNDPFQYVRSTLTIQTTADPPGVLSEGPHSPTRSLYAFWISGAGLLGAVILTGRQAKRRWLARIWLLVIVSCLSQMACGSGDRHPDTMTRSGTPRGMYTITVTGQYEQMVRSTQFQLLVK